MTKKHKKAKWRKRDNPDHNIFQKWFAVVDYSRIIDCSTLSETEVNNLLNEFITCSKCQYCHGKYICSNNNGHKYLLPVTSCPSCSS